MWFFHYYSYKLSHKNDTLFSLKLPSSNLTIVYFWEVVSLHLHMLPQYHQSHLGWDLHSEFRGIPQLFQFWTFWTPKFSSEFYFSDCKMCSRQFWTRFFRFGILSHHRLFRFDESKDVPAINVSGKWHQISIYSMHQLFLHAPLPSHCSQYLLDTHKN